MEVIWLSDSDICDRCDGILGDFGICTDCGWDGVDDEEGEEWDNDEDDSLYEGWYDEFCEIE